MTAVPLPTLWPEDLRARVEARPDGPARITQMARLVSKYARSLNLTGSSGDELWAQVGEGIAAVIAAEHAVGRALTGEDCWVDIGSGGGFPGLVLSALLESEILLVEPREKRVAFLELGMGSLGRRDRPVFRGRLEGTRVNGRDGDRFAARLAEARARGGAVLWGARAVFAPDEWLRRSSIIAVPGEVVVLHLNAGAEAPAGLDELSRFDYDRWTLVVGRLS